MKPVIQIDKISKQYRIGARQRRRYRTIRETIYELAALPWQRWRQLSSRVTNGTPAADSIWALKDVSFEVEQGDVLGIIGRNGAGKSTLLKILSQITEPTSGHARLRGRLASLLEVGTGFHPELTGRENIYLNGAILGMKKREIDGKFDEIIAFAEVEQFLDTPVKNYSSGMYVRLAFAVAAHLEPEILIVDEVLAVGDMEFQRKCMGKMSQVARSGRTILFVSHNMAAVQNLCAKAVLLSHGQVEQIGECADVLSSYLRSGYVREQEQLDLKSHRVRGKLPILQGVEVLASDGQPSEHFFVGDGLTIKLHYDCPVPLANAAFGIQVESMMGEKLCGLYTQSQHGTIPELPQQGTVSCHVPTLLLMPGTYLLSFYCSTGQPRGELDVVERALAITIEAADYFNTGKLPPARSGAFLVPANWSFAPANLNGPV
jgi:lipopolysaccharide transport system ATP-binding protein